MKKRTLSLVPLLAGALLAGCANADEGHTEADGVVPAGAVPAAPDVVPGTESAPGNVQQSGMEPGQVDDRAEQTTGARSQGVIDTTAAARPDTAR